MTPTNSRTKSFPATADGMAAATAFLDESCPSPRVSVIFDEIASNVVRCSGASAFEVSVGPGDGGMRLVVADDGTPFDPTKSEDPDTSAPIEARGVGGLGIFMVRKMAKSFAYERVGGRNVVTVVA